MGDLSATGDARSMRNTRGRVTRTSVPGAKASGDVANLIGAGMEMETHLTGMTEMGRERREATGARVGQVMARVAGSKKGGMNRDLAGVTATGGTVGNVARSAEGSEIERQYPPLETLLALSKLMHSNRE